MATPRIDLNADLGEAFGSWTMGDDAAMLDLVTSANVACGYHAGDAETMLSTSRLAAERGVVVGAHVAYRDLPGFGRHFVDVPPERLFAEVVHQTSALAGICAVSGANLRYVKPHGALYNAIVHHEAQADAVARAVATCNAAHGTSLAVLGLPDSAIGHAAARHGVAFHVEAFADRGYRSDGTLVPRSAPDAVLHDPHQIAQRVVTMVTRGTVTSSEGTEVAVSPDSICLHGDTPGAVEIARAVRAALAEAGVRLVPFVGV